jgi:hypothetical protein
MPEKTAPIEISADLKKMILRTGVLTICLFVLAVIFGINTYSLPIWHRFIDKSPETEVLIGKTNGWRGDDWALDLPLALSQLKSDPLFQAVNPLMGSGQQMYLPFKIPIKSVLVVFRPSVWGFVFGADHGLAWMWAFMVLGLFFSSFLLFTFLTDNFYLSFWGGLLVVLSPYFQAWNFHKAEIVTHALGILIGLLGVLRFKSLRVRWLWTIFAGWSASCFVFDMLYPPIAIVVAYFILFLGAGYLIQKYKDGELRFDRIFKFQVLAALAIFGFCMAGLYYDSAEYMAQIRNTVYPGKRVWAGGGLVPWTLFVEHFFLPLVIFVKKLSWGALSNVCEASSLDLFFPLVAVCVVGARASAPKSRRIQISLLVFIALMFIYGLFATPVFFAKASLLGMITVARIAPAVGLASLVLLVLFLNENVSLTRLVQGLCFGVWLVILSYVAYKIHREFPAVAVWILAVAILVQMLFTWLFVRRDRRLLPLLCLVHLPYLASNPIVHGGTQFIYHNPLGDKVLEVQAKDPQSKWVAINIDDPRDLKYSPFFPNYFRMLGVPSIGGYSCPPDLKFFGQLFKGYPAISERLNQCGYFSFRVIAAEGPPTIDEPSPGTININIDKDFIERLVKSGVRSFVFLDSDQKLASLGLSSDLHFVSQVDNKFIYHNE